MLKRLLVISILFSCLFAFSGCSSEEPETEEIELLEPMNAKLETAYVTKMDISQVELHDGAVIPDLEEFSFDENGYLYGIFVKPGDKVYKGDVLAGLMGKDYETIKNLEEEIKSLKEQMEKTFAEYDKELELARINSSDSTEKELDIKQKKELAEFELQQKKDRLEELKATDIGYICITAPYDSVVAAVSSARENSYVSKGTAMVALETGKEPMITCDYMTETTVNKVYSCYALVRGQRIELEYVPYSKNELKVIINNGVSPVSKFKLKNIEDSKFYVGDYASVIVIKNFRGNVLGIPQNAVYSDLSGSYVYEIKDGERIKRPVVLGLSDSANVEVIEGLEEGVRVYVKS